LIPPSCRLFESSSDLYQAVFIERPNRFVIRADMAGRRVDARYRGILIPLVSVQANDLAEAIVLSLLFARVKSMAGR
jgi:hypothetical protein